MSCLNPRKAFILGDYTNKDHKKCKSLKITNYACHHVEQDNPLSSWRPIYDKLISPHCYAYSTNYIEIPCGKCKGCQLDHAKEWANRILMEMKYYDENYFITLTYDDEHIPLNDNYPGAIKFNTGEIIEQYKTLKNDDLTQFLKNLRGSKSKGNEQKFKFFACGEYGEESMRPHYHIIAMGLHLDDLEPYGDIDKNLADYFTSDTLVKKWKKGNVLVAKACYETACYTARYVMKKINNEHDGLCKEMNIEPEFIRMSKGIGKRYFEDHNNVLDYSLIHIGTDNGSISFVPPRYFEKLAEKINPNILLNLKNEKNLFAKQKRNLKLERTDKSYLEMLDVQASKYDKLTKAIKRKGA